MGATDFYALHRCDPSKVSMREAFASKRQEAQHENGHGGYTGTIAEKNSVFELTPPLGMAGDEEIVEWAQSLVNEDDPRIRDKWGPAGAVRLSIGWYFFGWASE